MQLFVLKRQLFFFDSDTEIQSKTSFLHKNVVQYIFSFEKV